MFLWGDAGLTYQ